MSHITPSTRSFVLPTKAPTRQVFDLSGSGIELIIFWLFDIHLVSLKPAFLKIEVNPSTILKAIATFGTLNKQSST